MLTQVHILRMQDTTFSHSLSYQSRLCGTNLKPSHVAATCAMRAQLLHAFRASQNKAQCSERDLVRMLTKAVANGCITTEDEHACQSQQAQQPVHHWDVNLPFHLASCRQARAVNSSAHANPAVPICTYTYIHNAAVKGRLQRMWQSMTQQ